MDANPNPQPKSDAERAAYAERLVTDTVDRLDAERNRVGNIVLHPGDRIYYSRHDDGAIEYTLLDRDGDRYAVLSGHGHPDHPGDFVVDAIEFVPGGAGGKLLPVPQPYQEPHTQPVTLSGAVHQSGDPYHLSLTHAHQHGHDSPGIEHYAHDHPHPHSGDEFHRAGTFGHAADPHTHGHPGEPGPGPGAAA